MSNPSPFRMRLNYAYTFQRAYCVCVSRLLGCKTAADSNGPPPRSGRRRARSLNAPVTAGWVDFNDDGDGGGSPVILKSAKRITALPASMRPRLRSSSVNVPPSPPPRQRHDVDADTRRCCGCDCHRVAAGGAWPAVRHRSDTT